MAQYRAGQSGNPTGKPKGALSLVGRLRNYFKQHPDEADKVILALVRRGQMGDVRAIRAIVDYNDGLPTSLGDGLPSVRLIFVPAPALVRPPVGDVVEGEVVPVGLLASGIHDSR